MNFRVEPYSGYKNKLRDKGNNETQIKIINLITNIKIAYAIFFCLCVCVSPCWLSVDQRGIQTTNFVDMH
jgi:hypothetical protein